MQSNPIVVDGVLYVTTPTLKVVAVERGDRHARSGSSIRAAARAPGARFRHRGVTVHKDRVFVSYRSFLYALDRKTGTPIASFGTDGRIDLREGLGMPAEKLSVSASTPGVVFEDLLIMGSSVPETIPGSPGHIRAFDVNTGKLRWIFHTIPQPGEFGYDTWSKDAYKLSGGANAWAGVTVDAKLGDGVRRHRLGVVRLLRRRRGTATTCSPTACSRSTRAPASASGTSRASSTTCGTTTSPPRRTWSPSRATAARWTPSRRSRSTATSTCSNRRTGEPLFPIESRKVPPSTIDGERLSERQPYPVKPPPFTRQGLTEDMLTTRTPEAHAAVLARFRKYSSRLLRAAVVRGHDHLPRRRRRRRMGRRGVRSGLGAALRQLERDAVDREADPEQRHVALQQQVRDLPSRGPQGLAVGAVARGHRRPPHARGDRRRSSARAPAACRRFPTWARATSTTSSSS